MKNEKINYSKKFRQNQNKFEGSDFSEVQEESKNIAVVNIKSDQKLNLREEPNISSEIIKSLKNKESLEIIEVYDGEWTKVYTETGATGYVMTEYIKEL